MTSVRSGLSSQSVYSMSSSARVSRGTSVYGGAGGRNVRVSYASNGLGSGFDLTQGLAVGDSGFSISSNEKATMQNLNDRLASYLQKVHSLESANSRLELQIREWYEKRTPSSRDYSKYDAIIEDLRRKEMVALRSNMSTSSVNVEVDAKPQEDLSKVMEEIRSQYEGIVEKNRREMETWYKIKKSNLESQLAETESRYSLQLRQLQVVVDNLQTEISQVRMDIERQASEYQILLDIKTRLELEIAEYRRLLDGEDVK
ncbi:hypothetical protein XENOCAPTIV_013865 [Xenoophorus captivus]|uniref:IF rod domain-containing protein n=1 Tax=Xenoophorus captivus TaxID=1517983 RepID=A0ABV0RR35_9TELE